MTRAALDDVWGPGLVSGAALDDVQGPGLVSGAALDGVRGPGPGAGVRGSCGCSPGHPRCHPWHPRHLGPVRGPGLGSHIGFLNHFKIFTGNF